MAASGHSDACFSANELIAAEPLGLMSLGLEKGLDFGTFEGVEPNLVTRAATIG